jgi:hypothetical protein
MFTAQPTASGAALTAEASYIIKQNDSLQTECKEMRLQLQAAEKLHGEEMRALTQQHSDCEDELDKTEASLRYLRNLQRTLASLHQDSKCIADGYRACDKASESAEKAQATACRNLRALTAMLGSAYALTFATALLVDVSSAVAVFGTTTIGIVGASKYLLNINILPHTRGKAVKPASTASAAGQCVEGRRKELARKEKEYDEVVRGLPGIEELIDNI